MIKKELNDKMKVNGVSMPPDFWETVDKWAGEWETTRSAALRRIVLEWRKEIAKETSPVAV